MCRVLQFIGNTNPSCTATGGNNSDKAGQCHGCRWPGSLRHQVTGIHGIDNIGYKRPYLIRERISTTCFLAVLRNDKRWKYIFDFPKMNSARQEFIFQLSLPHASGPKFIITVSANAITLKHTATGHQLHWNGNVIILTKFSAMEAPTVVKMTAFPYQCTTW